MVVEVGLIDRPSVMVAVLGASTAVAALLLVFQGFLLSDYSSFDAGTAPIWSIASMSAVAVAVVLAIVGAIASTLWLLAVTSLWISLFWLAVGVFLFSLVLVAIAVLTVTALMVTKG